jgi:hypothetical protein
MFPAPKRFLLGLLAGVVVTSATARPATPAWPDTPLARTQALALLQTFNADLLSHPSATLTLERWCGAHGLADQPRILAMRDNVQKPLPDEDRVRLRIDANEPVKYRRVRLVCGEHVLSEADNWYVPARLTAEMNHILDTTDEPFGKVVKALDFHRETQSAELLWAPLPEGWETHHPTFAKAGELAIPHQVLRHQALLYTNQNVPFSLVIETYTADLLAFPPPPQS